ncbi:hypothetical protein [Herbidospora daliensis]|uniref:hypothetical protein n=1 Tax=Herbidospora daliensis TaxID=295585 RepID=UPI000AD7937B|nr:hypothetical protein [Herbidospora daliensis]
MADVLTESRRSVAARWRERLLQGSRHGQRHWATRTVYYAACREVAEAGGRVGREVLDVSGGSTSTLYTVVGPRARHSLAAAYGGELPDCFGRVDALTELARETVVYTFWSYRDSWLQMLESGPGGRMAAAEGLVLAVADFAADHPGLLRATGLEPPVCAVEDLMAVFGRRAVARDVFCLLQNVIIDATRGLHVPAEVVLDGVRPALESRVVERANEPLPALADAVVGLLSARLDPPQRRAAADLLEAAAEALRTAIRTEGRERDNGPRAA